MYIDLIIEKERKRLAVMLNGCKQELSKLPKGSISQKKVGNNLYYYLQFREGKKIVLTYLGKNEDEFIALKEGILRRKHLEQMITGLEKEIQTANKVLGTNI